MFELEFPAFRAGKELLNYRSRVGARVTLDRSLAGETGGPVAVAKGEAELVLTLTSEIVPVPGVQLLGPFPAELQSYVTIGAARSTHAKDPEAADSLLRQLTGSTLTSALDAHGMEPVE